MKNRIIVFVDSLNASGGIERIVSQLIVCWKRKYEILIITKDDGRCFYSGLEDIKTVSINNPRRMNMNSRVQRILATIVNSCVSIFKLRKLIKNESFSNIYVTTPMNAFEVYLSGVSGEKIVVSEHGSAYGVNKVYKGIKKLIYPKVKCISVPNKMDVDLYTQQGFPAIYVPHIVNIVGREKNDLNEKIVLNVGRLTPDKRQDLLIQCWSKINNKQGWKLIIVGDGEQREYLNNLVNELSLKDTVSIEHSTKRIEAYYKMASIFAFSSRFEGFGLVLVEAMSFGIPCISFDCPSGPRDIIENGKNGFLVRNNEVELFSKQLEDMMNLPQKELHELGSNAFNSVLEWKNDGILEQWDRIFG